MATDVHAEHVGSLLRQPWLLEARAKHKSGDLIMEELRRVEDLEIERIIRKQDETGLRSATDGELRRSWWHLDFLWGLGCERYQMEEGVAFAGTMTRPEGARVVERLRVTGEHPMVAHYRFLAAHILPGQTAKMTIPAPSALYGRTGHQAVSRSAYGDLGQFFDELGQAYRQVVRQFADAGCRYLQLDEVMIAMLCDPAYRKRMSDRGDDPDRLALIYADMINVAMSDIPSDMVVTMHLCRGNYKSTYMGAGGYETVEDALFNRTNVHGYFLEYDSERAGGFAPLRRLPRGKVAVLGLVTTKSGALESKDTLKRRIDEAAKHAPLEQLALSGQCGFASTEEGNILTEEEQWAKLRLIVEVAQEVWGGR